MSCFVDLFASRDPYAHSESDETSAVSGLSNASGDVWAVSIRPLLQSLDGRGCWLCLGIGHCYIPGKNMYDYTEHYYPFYWETLTFNQTLSLYKGACRSLGWYTHKGVHRHVEIWVGYVTLKFRVHICCRHPCHVIWYSTPNHTVVKTIEERF